MGKFRIPRTVVTLLGVLATCVVFGLPLFIDLGSQDLGNDEAIYSYAVDRMVEGEGWLTPMSIPTTWGPGDPGTRVGGFFEKPPLKFWIVALSIRLGLLPLDEFGLRFWDALFGAVAFVYVFLIGRRLVDPLCGLAAVFLLFIDDSLLFAHGLRSNVMEAPLLLAYTAGIYHFLAWSEGDRRLDRWLHIFAFAGWFTLGFMTKFVAAIFLPAVVGLTALCLPDWRRRLRVDLWRWMAGGLVASMLILPWFAYQYINAGPYFWDVIFSSHVYDRVIGTLHTDHAQPWFFYLNERYLHLTQAGAFGWVIAGAALWLVESVRRGWKGGVLIVVWFLLPVGIISISVAKLRWYIDPFLPPLALVGAYAVSRLVTLLRELHSGSGWGNHVLERAGLDRRRESSLGLAGHWGATWLFRTARHAALAAALALVVYVWPIQQYPATFETLREHRSPLADLRLCLVEKFDELKLDRPDTISGVYVHLPASAGLTHNYYYHYRVLGRWERLAKPSDADLYKRLFVPGYRAPSIVFEDELASFLDRIGRPEFGVELRDLGAEVGDPTLVAGEPGGPLPEVAAVRLRIDGATQTVVVLPGPLAGCADEVFATGGERLETVPGPWRAVFHDTADLTGEPVAVKQYSVLDFDWGQRSPLPDLPEDTFSIRWDTCVTLDAAIATTIQLASDGGSRLFINGRPIIDHWGEHAFYAKEGVLALGPGVHHLEVHFAEIGGDARVRLEDAGLFTENRLAYPSARSTTPCDDSEASFAQPPL